MPPARNFGGDEACPRLLRDTRATHAIAHGQIAVAHLDRLPASNEEDLPAAQAHSPRSGPQSATVVGDRAALQRRPGTALYRRADTRAWHLMSKYPSAHPATHCLNRIVPGWQT